MSNVSIQIVNGIFLHVGNNGDTALHRASRLGMEKTIKTIIEKCGTKLDTNIRNNRSLTAFDVAGMFENGRKHVLFRKKSRRALASAIGGEHLKSLICAFIRPVVGRRCPSE